MALSYAAQRQREPETGPLWPEQVHVKPTAWRYRQAIPLAEQRYEDYRKQEDTR